MGKTRATASLFSLIFVILFCCSIIMPCNAEDLTPRTEYLSPSDESAEWQKWCSSFVRGNCLRRLNSSKCIEYDELCSRLRIEHGRNCRRYKRSTSRWCISNVKWISEPKPCFYRNRNCTSDCQTHTLNPCLQRGDFSDGFNLYVYCLTTCIEDEKSCVEEQEDSEWICLDELGKPFGIGLGVGIVKDRIIPGVQKRIGTVQ